MVRTPRSLTEAVESGWSIQIYSSDRRLICSLYPSHGGALLGGIILGFLMAILVLQNQNTASFPQPNHSLEPVEAPLQLD